MAISTYNLSQFRELINGVTTAEALNGMVGGFVAACSQRQDLKTVRLYLDEILEIDRGDVAKAGVLGGSLWMSAVITYARATKYRSGQMVDVRPALSSHQADKHRHILDVRNKVMAHFDQPQKSNGGFEWVEEIGYLKEGDSEEPMAWFAFNRANYLADEVNDLLELLSAIVPFLSENIDRRRNAMLAELQLTRADAEIERQLQACLFDLSEWWGAERGTETMFYTRVPSP